MILYIILYIYCDMYGDIYFLEWSYEALNDHVAMYMMVYILPRMNVLLFLHQ